MITTLKIDILLPTSVSKISFTSGTGYITLKLDIETEETPKEFKQELIEALGKLGIDAEVQLIHLDNQQEEQK